MMSIVESVASPLSGLSIVTLEDKLVCPLVGPPLQEELQVSGGDPQGLFTHRRYVHGRERITIAAVEAPEDMESRALVDEAIFGGYLFAHYGHFIAESIHRLWPVLCADGFRHVKIVFAASSMHGGATALRPFMTDLFTYLGIDPARVMIVAEPVMIRRLHVPQQARWLGRPPISAYDALFRRFGPAPAKDAPNVYVTRSRHAYSGGYLGELLVEEILAAAGVKVIVPEDLGIEPLMATYRGAANIVFSEGSAVHLIEISGGVEAHVMVIGRRDPDFTDERFIHSLRQLSASAMQFPRHEALPPLKLANTGRPERSWAPVVVDIRALLRRLEEFYGLPLPVPERSGIVRAMVMDLGRIVLDPRSSGDAGPLDLGRRLVAMRRHVEAIGLLENVFGDD